MPLVQTATKVTVQASSTTAPSITIVGTAGGNAIVALASIWDNNAIWTITNTTDGANTFTTRDGAATKAGASRSRAVAAHAVNITGGDRTVAVNLADTSGAGNRYYVIGCLEFSGVATSSAEDTFDANADIDTSATDTSAGPITTTDAGDVLVGAASINSADATLNFASPASWNNSYRDNDANTTIGFDAGYWIPAGIQTNYTAQWAHDNNSGDIGGGVVVALHHTAGGAGGDTSRYYVHTQTLIGVG